MAELAIGADARGASSPVRGPSGESARLVYEEILRRGPRPRSELAALLQLSGATLTRVTRDMLDTGLLREMPLVTRERGRPQEPLDVDEDHARFIGVKITAREAVAMVTTVRGKPLEEASLPMRFARAENVQETVSALVAPLLADHAPVAGVGVSLAGRVTDDGVVLSSSMLHWDHALPLAEQLTAALGVPVTVQNDLIALLQGVLWFGIGRRYDSFVLVTIDTGIATGIVHRGQVIDGRTHLAGLTETLPTAGPDGRHVRLSEIAGGRALVARAREAGVIGSDGELEDLLAAHRHGDPAALEIGSEVAEALAVSAGTLVGLLDPEAIIFGGETLGMVDSHRECFDTLLHRQLSPMQRDIAVRRLPADVDEWTRGAAVTAIQRFAAGR